LRNAAAMLCKGNTSALLVVRLWMGLWAVSSCSQCRPVYLPCPCLRLAAVLSFCCLLFVSRLQYEKEVEKVGAWTYSLVLPSTV
jgi:hypothetical protein